MNIMNANVSPGVTNVVQPGLPNNDLQSLLQKMLELLQSLDQFLGAVDVTHRHKKQYHFDASVSAASWSYGSGVVRPGGIGAGPSINATITLPYIDVKPEWKVRTDEKNHTITVTIDGVSPNTVHPLVAVRPQDINIPVQRPKDLGAEYKIVFATPKGQELFETTFRNMLPA